MDRGFSGTDGIALMNQQRVYIQHLCHGIDVRIEGELHLRPTKPTECTVGWRMGIDQTGMGANILNSMHVVAAHGRDMHHFRGQARIGTAVGQDAHIFGQDDAIGIHADF